MILVTDLYTSPQVKTILSKVRNKTSKYQSIYKYGAQTSLSLCQQMTLHLSGAPFTNMD